MQNLNKEKCRDMKKLGKGRERADGKGKHLSVMGEHGEKQNGIPSRAKAVRGQESGVLRKCKKANTGTWRVSCLILHVELWGSK